VTTRAAEQGTATHELQLQLAQQLQHHRRPVQHPQPNRRL
jgi:hypothetical protein